MSELLLAARRKTDTKLYVDDVFSTYLYNGNSGTQKIINDIDLAENGGLICLKSRSNATDNVFLDTIRGGNSYLSSNTVNAENTTQSHISSFNNDGFTLTPGPFATTNSTGTYSSWTFRRAPKFLDIVTYTGNGVAGRQIPHELGITPGMVVIKRIDVAHGWEVWHRGNGSPIQLQLDDTGAGGFGYGAWVSATTDITFTVNSDFATANSKTYSSNINGAQYVAYLFAHDDSEDGIIQCGSFISTGAIDTINLGFEPQFGILKSASISGGWEMYDVMRGITSSNESQRLQAQSPNAEAPFASGVAPNATGFTYKGGVNGQTYIYLAIRRPNKPPTSGAEVYNAIARTGTGAAATISGVGFAPDVAGVQARNGAEPMWLHDRLRGFSSASTSALQTNTSSAEFGITSSNGGVLLDGATTGSVQYTTSTANLNRSAAPYIQHFFRRAPGFFDVVCYTGTGVARTVPHNLGVAPELMIVKPRTDTYNWVVYHSYLGASQGPALNRSNAQWWNAASSMFNDVAPTPISFSVGVDDTNRFGTTTVAYLFASLPDISKVGGYAGNGTTQPIPCDFTTGARFILIKRTDAAGDWFMWDTARGIVAANDPHLSLNTTAAEVATDDSVDPHASGFIVNQVAATNINVLNGQYIFLAIA